MIIWTTTQCFSKIQWKKSYKITPKVHTHTHAPIHTHTRSHTRWYKSLLLTYAHFLLVHNHLKPTPLLSHSLWSPAYTDYISPLVARPNPQFHPFVQIQESYKPIDAEDIRLPAPAPPSERVLQAVENFYNPPSREQPRDELVHLVQFMCVIIIVTLSLFHYISHSLPLLLYLTLSPSLTISHTLSLSHYISHYISQPHFLPLYHTSPNLPLFLASPSVLFILHMLYY